MFEKVIDCSLDRQKFERVSELQKLEANGDSVVLFGAGTIGEMHVEIIKQLHNVPLLFCDNDSNKVGRKILGVPVISFKELKQINNRCKIIITSLTYYNSLKTQLQDNQLGDNIIDSLDEILVSGEYENYYKKLKKREIELENMYSWLCDDISKKTLIGRLNYCITGDKKYLKNIIGSRQQYFDNDIIVIEKDEVFIDAGGFIGDTIGEFIKASKNRFNKIISFEPEEKNYLKAKNKFFKDDRVVVENKGIWSKTQNIGFSCVENASSSICYNGEKTIEVVSIDEYFKGQKIGFIKMDVEGAEIEAIKGAKQTIGKFSPKLAICVYHKPFDIIEIPRIIKNINKSYKFYLRHYSMFSTETVLYAVK